MGVDVEECELQQEEEEAVARQTPSQILLTLVLEPP